MAQVIVNKSDTFEVQRQKINEIGLDLHTFNSSQIILNASYITLIDLSVTVNSAGGAGNLTYDNTTGAIAYTPPDLSNFITSIGDAIQDADFTSAGLMVTDGSGNYSVVTDNSATWVTLQGLQVTNNTPSAGGSSLSYNNTTGVFGFTPQDVSTFITLSDISVTSLSASGNGSLTYDNSTGVLSFTPLDINSFNSITVGGNGSTGGVTISDGSVAIRTGTGNVAAIDLYCEVNNAHKVSIKAPAHSAFSGNHEFVLPPDEGTNGQVLQTDGNGVTTWVDQTGGSTPTLAAVTAAGNTTTDDITAGSLICSDTGQFSIGTSQFATLGYNAAGSKVIYNGNNSDLDIVADQLDYYSGATLKATLSTTGLNVVGSVTGTSFVKTGGTASQFLKADGTVDTSTYLTGIDIEDISNVNITSIQTNQILKWDGTEWVNALDSGGSGGGIALGDLTVGTEGTPSGNGGLSYNNLTGQFTFTPAADNTLVFNHANATTSQIVYTNNGAGNAQTLNLVAGTGITFGQGGGTGALTITGTSGIALTDLSIGTEGSASGDGAIAYNDTTGEFSYTPPDLSGYLTGYTETDTLDDVAGRGATTDKNITLTGTASFPGRFDVQNNGNYAISLNATSGVGINTNDGVGLYIGNLATNVWRASISGSTGDITGNKFVKTSGTSSQFLKADGSVDSNTYLTSISLASSNINDLADVNAGTPTDGHVLKWDAGSSKWIAAADQTATGGAGISLTDLSVTTNSAGTAALSYNNGTGVFSYTPPDLSAVSTDLTAFSVGSNASASGGGGLAYNNTSGAFTYTPPDLSSYITGLSVNELSDVTISSPQNGHVLKYNGTSWENGPDETGSGNADNIAENNTKVETIDTGGGTGKITFDIEGTEAVQIDANRQILIAGTQSGNNVAKIFNDTDGAGTGVLGIYASSNNANPRDVRIYSGGGTANEIFRAGKSGQLGVAGDVGSTGQVLTSGGPNAAATWENQVTPGIQLTALSVTQNSAGTAGLSYNNVSGVFSYTPPNISSFITLGGLSVGSPQTASGDGSISYNSVNGVFSYTPPDLSAHLTTSSVIGNLADVVISGSPQSGQVLKWDNGTSKWTNQADSSGGSTLTTEQVQDIVGAMFSGNTETRIAATYQDGDGTIDLVVDDMTANTQPLTTEQVQDIVGGMFSGNTETRIAATYQDADGTIDLVVDDQSGSGGASIIADLTDVVISGSPADDQVLAWDNSSSKWTNQTPGGGIPAGGIIMWSGSVANIPSGWYLCNGSYGTPDLRDRFVIGAGSSYNPGASGGATSVTLSTSNMPSHSHTGASHSHTIGSHSHTVSSHSHTIGSHTHTFSSLVNGYTSIQSDNHYHTANTGSGGAHTHTYSRLNSQTSYTRGIPIGSGGAAGSSFGTFTTDSAGAHTHYVETGGVSDNHDHTLNATVNGTTGASSGSTSSENPGTSSNGSGNTGSGGSGNTGSAGSGSAVSTMPPYYALCFIMKT